MARPLGEGVYEHPLTRELDRALEAIGADRRQLGDIDDAEGPVTTTSSIERRFDEWQKGSPFMPAI